MRGAILLGLAVALSGLGAGAASGQSLLGRTITVDGNLSDWYAAPSVPDNPGQASTDCEAGEACELDEIQSTGRDLRRFGFTWDEDNLYFYVERYASSSNSNTWLFYLDENTDSRMQTGERIFRVDWWGSNRETTSHLCVYTAVDAAGDSIFGDGHTMPGSGSSCTSNLYAGSVRGGSLTGVEMESRLAWSDLGYTGPGNIRFHISSSRGMNLPSHVEDNMVGPGGGTDGGGGELFPPDMAVAVAAGADSLAPFQEGTLTVTLTNVYFDPFDDVEVTVPLPPQLAHVAHTATAGSFNDTDADGRPDLWTVPTLAAEQVATLTITVRAAALPAASVPTTSVSITAWTGTDTEPSNNAASVSVAVRAAPDVTVSQSASTDDASPGAPIEYTIVVRNPADAAAHGLRLQTALDPNVALLLDAFGPGAPLLLTDGSTPSGLTPGAIEYSSDGGATWTYTPVSGGGGAPAGYDGAVTHWRLTLGGAMVPGGTFSVRYIATPR